MVYQGRSKPKPQFDLLEESSNEAGSRSASRLRSQAARGRPERHFQGGLNRQTFAWYGTLPNRDRSLVPEQSDAPRGQRAVVCHTSPVLALLGVQRRARERGRYPLGTWTSSVIWAAANLRSVAVSNADAVSAALTPGSYSSRRSLTATGTGIATTACPAERWRAPSGTCSRPLRFEFKIKPSEG